MSDQLIVPSSAPAASSAPALNVTELTGGYGDLVVVRSATLSVQAHQVLALIGRNGAGKTTLVSLIAGIVRAKSGTIEMDGRSISQLPPHERVTCGLALVQQGKRIFHRRSVYENLLLGGARLPRAARADAIEAVIELFPMLRSRYRHAAGSLSGGQQQMLAIAQALIPSPNVLMLDEPSSGLAPIIVDEMLEIIVKLKNDGKAVILVEQLVDKALKVADMVAILDQGRIAVHSPVAEVDRQAIQHAYLGGVVHAPESERG